LFNNPVGYPAILLLKIKAAQPSKTNNQSLAFCSFFTVTTINETAVSCFHPGSGGRMAGRGVCPDHRRISFLSA
jgi:hypothetical protein